MANGYRVSMTDEDVAGTVLAAADAAGPSGNWGLYRVRVVAVAVAAGRAIGKREGIEPLDDAMRSAVDSELLDLVRTHAPGRHAWVMTLSRLQGFLERYPARGIADEAQETNGG